MPDHDDYEDIDDELERAWWRMKDASERARRERVRSLLIGLSAIPVAVVAAILLAASR